MTGHVFIYALASPDNPKLIRYIGKTEKPLRRRLCEHVAESNKNLPTCHRRNWIKKLFSEGKKPLIWLIETCSKEIWESRERYWISLFKPMGLVNKTDGGEGGLGNRGWKWKPEAIAKISASRKGKKATPSQLRNLEIGRITRFRNRKTTFLSHRTIKRLKLPITLKIKRRHSEETKSKLSAKLKGRKAPWAIRAQLNKDITSPLLKAANESRKKKVFGSDGTVFNSISELTKTLGVSERGFKDCVKNGWRVKGVHWTIQKKE